MATINPITIDPNKCVGCSLCVKDCPSNYLYIKDTKANTHDAGCIECGHCFAICPQGAVTMNNYDTSECSDVVSMEELDSDLLLQAMKSRRTVRQFKSKVVEQETIDKILEAGRYCPTGGNFQNISYTILGSRQADAEKQCIKIFRRGLKLVSPFVKMAKNMKIDDNFFFKGAPLVIVVSSRSKVDAGLASSYMELMAESMGLGVLYSGFFAICSKISPKLKRMMQLPKGHKVVTCMVIGYPSVKYQKTVPRKELKAKKL